MPLSVLFVCTGNICRSPAAAALTRAAASGAIVVTSAGLAALTGRGIDPPVAAALAARGVHDDAHRARDYAPWMALDADLVLTATAAHSAQILRELPQAHRRVFTAKEFVRLATQTTTGRRDPKAVVAAAAGMRGLVAAMPAGSDDLPDPFRRGDAAAAASVAEIATVARRLVDSLDLAAVRRPQPYPR